MYWYDSTAAKKLTVRCASDNSTQDRWLAADVDSLRWQRSTGWCGVYISSDGAAAVADDCECALANWDVGVVADATRRHCRLVVAGQQNSFLDECVNHLLLGQLALRTYDNISRSRRQVNPNRNTKELWFIQSLFNWRTCRGILYSVMLCPLTR